MKILVTGGAGFIGSNFIHYWLAKYPADFIVNFDKLTYAGDLNNLAGLESSSNYQFIKGDITDPTAVALALDGVELIVHFAAETHVDRSIADDTDFIKTNIEGTRVLLDAARKNNIRFHHISTDEVFGSLEKESPKFNETTPYDPRSPYSASKAGSDHLVRAYFHTYGLPITISNCSNNYGPRQFPEKLIPLAISKIKAGQKIPIYGDGKNIRDWIFVGDHNRGVELIIKNGKIGETYCLGGNSETSNLEIINLLLEIMNADKNSIEFVEDRLGHDFRYAIDFSKAERELGFRPEISLEDGLRDTVKWYNNKK